MASAALPDDFLHVLTQALFLRDRKPMVLIKSIQVGQWNCEQRQPGDMFAKQAVCCQNIGKQLLQ